MKKPHSSLRTILKLMLFLIIGTTSASFAQDQYKSGNTVYADIVAIDLPIHYNRLGVYESAGLIYALKSDVYKDNTAFTTKNGIEVPCSTIEGNCAGCMRLKPAKRPRPIVLRSNIGDELVVTLTNYITPETSGVPVVGFSINGVAFVNSTQDDGSWIGANTNNQVKANETKTYKLYTPEEGSFLIRDAASDNTSYQGLFGSLTVHPKNAEWYRSQVTQIDLFNATKYYLDAKGAKIKFQKIVKKNNKPETLYVDKPISNPVNPPGHPIIDYSQLQMYQQISTNERRLIATDLTAIITGPNAGRFPDSDKSPIFNEVPSSPDRRQPYREIAIHYHNTFGSTTLTQAFQKELYDQTNKVPGLTGNDIFALNYGSAGITSEIFANRVGVGPMADCIDCSYEEFFLSSWAAGDPAMRVDIDATSSLHNGVKATKAFYPDDPSNVYHSYMNDHVKFRINHASPSVTHVHHQHAHQWLHSPNSDNGHYMDSQTINPGASWTLEMVYNGSGNRNKVVGDNIFHCHFYPHFASGMWSLWRVHDVLETGTALDVNGMPVKGSRALPDAEIKSGTPIPAIVPMPTLAMGPIPGKVSIEDGQVIVEEVEKNPGFPFFIPGIAGKRGPHPPLDFAIEGKDTLDGGLPRHIITDGVQVHEVHNATDWTKIIDSIHAIQLPEAGTLVELTAMRAHATRHHPSFKPDGQAGSFTLNGLKQAPGAPFAAPYVGDNGERISYSKRTYKAADIQMDVISNKKGWHYPQQRMIALWGDVASTIDGTRAPEPFFFRANSGDYIEFWQTNLVPGYYDLDDFQVRTPTDIIGQHIHLVKFDVTSSDGAANGWNYEDGSFSPDQVRDRISAIKNGSFNKYKYHKDQPILKSTGSPIDLNTLAPKSPKSIWGNAPSLQNWNGAQTTVQLWYADPLLSNPNGKDRTIRTVFTHDHFGPSTHQQVGLYAGLLVEPTGSRWQDPESGDYMGSRFDGGPTSFQANIITPHKEESYREFALEFQGIQLSYEADSKEMTEADKYPEYPFENPTKENIDAFNEAAKKYTGYLEPEYAINPPYTNSTDTVSSPQIISVQVGGHTINYRNEPTPLRLRNPDGSQANGPAGDLAYLFSSNVERADPALNKQPIPGDGISPNNSFKYPALLTEGVQARDPYTPLLRAYENDRIQVRTLVGAHEDGHIFNMQGVPWLFEPSYKNSGYRNTQMMSISEHFEMEFQLPKGTAKVGGATTNGGTTDYLYNASSDFEGLKGGIWGIIRAYDKKQPALTPLPNNKLSRLRNKNQTSGCPDGAPKANFAVSAYMVSQITPAGRLIYNQRDEVFDEYAMVFVEDKDIVEGLWNPNKKLEPLVLRAHSGDCITVNLTNHINPSDTGSFNQFVNLSFPNGTGDQIGSTAVTASANVSLHAQLLSYNGNESSGFNVGFNQEQTTAPSEQRAYTWYAGRWNDCEPTDIEFGTVLLSSGDALEQYARGLFGAIIIEPKGATWTVDENAHTSATIDYTDIDGNKKSFREFVLFSQDNLILNHNYKDTITGGMAVNYKTEISKLRNVPSYENTANQAVFGDPETPVFAVGKGTPVRIRLIKPGGSGNPESFLLTGHGWQEEPYQNNSTVLGDNPESQYLGSRPQVAAINNFDLLINKAGGEFEVPGDYLYRPYQGGPYSSGVWGLMRVTEGVDAPIIVQINSSANDNNTVDITGTATVNPLTGKLPTSITASTTNYSNSTTVNKPSGNWVITGVGVNELSTSLTITSDIGGSRRYSPTELDRLIPRQKVRSTNQAEAAEAIETAKVLLKFQRATRKTSEKQE